VPTDPLVTPCRSLHQAFRTHCPFELPSRPHLSRRLFCLVGARHQAAYHHRKALVTTDRSIYNHALSTKVGAEVIATGLPSLCGPMTHFGYCTCRFGHLSSFPRAISHDGSYGRRCATACRHRKPLVSSIKRFYHHCCAYEAPRAPVHWFGGCARSESQ
jgi:hypothetical protein